jgi:hypothetical protein
MANVSGWITQEKYILGSKPAEMEYLLGVPRGYFSHGAAVWALQRLPHPNEFELGGFTHWPGGLPRRGQRDTSIPSTSAFISKHKGFARDLWSLAGPDRLVKVVPNWPPTHIDSWPVGKGVKQWKLLTEIPAPRNHAAGSESTLFAIPLQVLENLLAGAGRIEIDTVELTLDVPSGV